MMKPDWNVSKNPTCNCGASHDINASQATNKLAQRSRSFSFSGLAKLATGLHKYTVTSAAEHAIDVELTLNKESNSSFRNRSNSDSGNKFRSTRLKLPMFRKSESSMMPIGVKLRRKEERYGCTLPSVEPSLEESICLSDTLSFTVSRRSTVIIIMQACPVNQPQTANNTIALMLLC